MGSRVEGDYDLTSRIGAQGFCESGVFFVVEEPLLFPYVQSHEGDTSPCRLATHPDPPLFLPFLCALAVLRVLAIALALALSLRLSSPQRPPLQEARLPVGIMLVFPQGNPLF